MNLAGITTRNTGAATVVVDITSPAVVGNPAVKNTAETLARFGFFIAATFTRRK
jgi:hypothetical protein